MCQQKEREHLGFSTEENVYLCVHNLATQHTRVFVQDLDSEVDNDSALHWLTFYCFGLLFFFRGGCFGHFVHPFVLKQFSN